MTFDFHSDTPAGKDPDSFSPALRKYHQLLWSKELPTGPHFHLTVEPGAYLVHRSSSGVFFLASATTTTRLRKKAWRVVREIPEDDLPQYVGYTAGSTLVFPGNRIGRKPTINGARGLHPRIADRFDLTLECIRRHYLGEPSPLANVLLRYAEFFALFGISPGTSNSFFWKTSWRMTARQSDSSTRSPTSAHQPFRRTVTDTSSTYGSATLSSPHAIEGSMQNLKAGSHDKSELH